MKKPVEPDDIQGARKKALSLLKDRDYTEQRLRDKLIKAGYSEDTSDSVVSWARECRYVDDRLYCSMFIEQQSTKKSRLRIKSDLIGRGVEPGIVEEALFTVPDEGQEVEAAVRKLKSRRYRPDETDPEYIKATAAYLFRQGFSGDVVRKAMTYDEEGG